MPSVTVGLTVSCSQNNAMDNASKIILSGRNANYPEPGPQYEQTFEWPAGAGAEDIAKDIAAGFPGASAKSTTVSSGTGTNASGSTGGRSTVAILLTFDGWDSIDITVIAQGKIRVYVFATEAPHGGSGGGGSGSGGGRGGGSGGGGGTTSEPGGVAGFKVNKKSDDPPINVDCEEYRRKLEEERQKKERANRNKKNPDPTTPTGNPGTPKDWFCRDDREWTEFAQIGGFGPVGHLVVATGNFGFRDVQAFMSSGGHPSVVVVPFRILPGPAAMQAFEMRMQLAFAGVVTQARDDDVIVPVRIIAGSLEGEPVTAFGFVAPYNPLGYELPQWTMYIGDPEDVSRHSAGPNSVHVRASLPLGPWQSTDVRGVEVQRRPRTPYEVPQAAVLSPRNKEVVRPEARPRPAVDS